MKILKPFHNLYLLCDYCCSMCDMDFDQHMETYMSPNVHSLLCEVGVQPDTDVEMSNMLVDGCLNWPALSSALTEEVGSRESYIRRVHILAPVFHTIHHYYRGISTVDFGTNFGRYFEWTAEPSEAVRCFSIVQSETSTAVNHSLLLITSVLERALGDAVLLRSTHCPSLLRDLLTMTELEELLSYNVVQLLQTLIGPPLSLNLRNVVWHGFPRPGELHAQYVYILLCVTASIGKLLKDKRVFEIPRRTMVQITVPAVFSPVDLSQLDDVLQLFQQSAFVAPSIAQFWHLSLELYASGHYGECVVVILPQLELALRRVFVAVNGCSDRILTAENTVLYTTLDEILDKLLPDGSENRLISAIGESYLTLLMDCFHYPNGPRVRDHISHGEVLLADVSKDTASHLICICIAVASKFCLTDFTKQNIELVEFICNKADNYESLYHPISVVKQQTVLVARSVSLWCLMPQPSTDDLAAVHVMDRTQPSQMQTVSAAYRAVENYVTALSADDKVVKSDYYLLLTLDDIVAEVEKLLGSLQLNTLYRYHHSTLPSREEEILRLLVRIGKLCVCTSEQILDIAENRYRLWQAKQLRSRQRTNYKKFLATTASISVTMRFVIITILITVKLLDDLGQEAAKQRRLVKLFKHVQKYCENMVNYTRSDVNRWDEAQTASDELVTRVQLLTVP